MNKTLTIAAALALLATPVLAQNNAAFIGPRVEVAAGANVVSNFSTDNITLNGAVGIDAPIGDNWTLGAELTANNVWDDSADLGIGARLGYAFTPKTLAFARVGYTSLKAFDHFSDKSLELGAGVEYLVTENAYVNAQYRYVDQGSGANNGALIGVGYRF